MIIGVTAFLFTLIGLAIGAAEAIMVEQLAEAEGQISGIEGRDRVLVTRGLHRDGSRLYVDLSFAVIVDDGGRAEGALAVGRNVTERYLADRALRKRVAELEGGGAPSG